MSHCKYLVLLLLLASCSLFDTEQPEPMFVSMESANLTTTPEQGVNSHKIRDVSVYADGFSIGLYPLPARVPVLSEKESVEMVVFAVVRNNGIASNPIEYPYYEPIRLEYPFVPFTTIEQELVFSYTPQAEIRLIADFESGNALSVNIDDNPAIGFVRSADTPYGDFCGRITLTEEHPVFEKASQQPVDRSEVFGSSVFLEMDYRNEVPFAVGIVEFRSDGFFVPVYKLVLTEQAEWNKVYIELTGELSNNQIEQFTILIGSSQGSSGLGSIWVDNLRLVHN